MKNPSQSRVLIVGRGGRLTNSFCKVFQLSEKPLMPSILSSREIGTTKFDLTIEAAAQSSHFYDNTVLWCSGGASNRSSALECRKDEYALKKFLDVSIKKFQTPPNFWYFSSGGTVYGSSPGEVNESSPLNPQTAYAEMKLRSEQLLVESCQRGEIGLFVFRLANLYGVEGINNRRSLIDTALLSRDIRLVVNPDSVKQYGIYDDYARFVIGFSDKVGSEPGIPVIKNIFSDHAYSIAEILEMTKSYNPHLENRRVIPPDDCSRFENVILSSVVKNVDLDFTWLSLESHLQG